MPIQIDIPEFHLSISANPDTHLGQIESTMARSACQKCKRIACCSAELDYDYCDGCRGEKISDEEVIANLNRLQYNAAVDAIEALLLFLACEGVHMSTEAVTNSVAGTLNTLECYYGKPPVMAFIDSEPIEELATAARASADKAREMEDEVADAT